MSSRDTHEGDGYMTALLSDQNPLKWPFGGGSSTPTPGTAPRKEAPKVFDQNCRRED